MPLTRRGLAVAAIALLLYFFANQTQVGWLYVLSALAAGLWLTALLLPGRMLRGLSLSRRVNGSDIGAEAELYAGQPIRLEWILSNASRLPAILVRGRERLALAPRPERDQHLFFPNVPGRSEQLVLLQTTCGRRGWFPFEPLLIETAAPFGFSRARRTVAGAGPDGVLVFPEYREIERLSLFDRRPSVETNAARAGAAGEFIGVREYRPGDPRRNVHWRSTARAGRLIVKEYSEETQPSLSMALDLRAESAVGPQGDTLELGIKIAASLARYALEHDLPFSFTANSRRWPPPAGPLSWWGLMSYLARVQPGGDEPFSECLHGLPPGTFVAAILPAPDPNVLAPLRELQRAGATVWAVLIDPAPFVTGEAGHAYGVAARRLAAELESAGVTARLVGAEPDWERALAA